MERAALLLDAHYYQDHADRARVRLQELERQVEALEAECRDLQATIRDLVTRAEQRVQEVSSYIHMERGIVDRVPTPARRASRVGSPAAESNIHSRPGGGSSPGRKWESADPGAA